MNTPERILIRATNWIGDAVMSLPALRAVRGRFPQAHISVLARPWVADLYAFEPVDRVIPYTAAPGLHDLRAKWRAARALRAERFDLAILFQNAFEAALIAQLGGARHIIGYNRDGRSWLLSQAVPVPAPGDIPPHQRFGYLELLRRAGILNELPPSESIRLAGIDQFRREGERALTARGVRFPVVGVSPGAAYGAAKRWIPERFAEAAAQLAAEHGASVCLFGSPAERALCQSVADLIPSAPVWNLAGETLLRGFLEAAAACLLFLTNDSGAMHIASALGIPTVTVFGATDHIATGPTGPLARIVREPVSCSPCLLRECPIDHRCMTAVSAGHVVAAAEELLSLGVRT